MLTFTEVCFMRFCPRHNKWWRIPKGWRVSLLRTALNKEELSRQTSRETRTRVEPLSTGTINNVVLAPNRWVFGMKLKLRDSGIRRDQSSKFGRDRFQRLMRTKMWSMRRAVGHGMSMLSLFAYKQKYQIIRPNRSPQAWSSIAVSVRKGKDDTLYRSIQHVDQPILFSHTLNIVDRIMDQRLREIIGKTRNHCRFMRKLSTTDTMHTVHLAEKYREKHKFVHAPFRDHEMAFEKEFYMKSSSGLITSSKNTTNSSG